MTEDRVQFDAECRAAGLRLSAADHEALYQMWLEWLPERQRLRDAIPQPEEEPWR